MPPSRISCRILESLPLASRLDYYGGNYHIADKLRGKQAYPLHKQKIGRYGTIVE